MAFEIPKPKTGSTFGATETRSNWHKTKTPEYQKMHTSERWRQLRELQLSEYPLCEIRHCDHPGVECHRVEPNDYSLFFKRSNHRSLCERHHKQIGVLLRMKQETKHLFKERN
jgi:hypothetical protein